MKGKGKGPRELQEVTEGSKEAGGEEENREIGTDSVEWSPQGLEICAVETFNPSEVLGREEEDDDQRPQRARN